MPNGTRSPVTMRPLPKRPSITTACVALERGRNGPRRCGARSTGHLAGMIPLCTLHFDAATLEVTRRWREDPQRLTEWHRAQETNVVTREITRIVRVHTAGPAVVYYIGNPPTQRVKIGTSTRFRTRFANLKRTFPEIVLLAVEPGHFELESHRHIQFAELRECQDREREWFRKAPVLMQHINDVRRRHGDPDAYQLDQHV